MYRKIYSHANSIRVLMMMMMMMMMIPGLIWVAMQGILEEKPGQSSL